MILYPDFKDLLNTFNAHQVEYLVIGAFAVYFYAGPRSTGDMDIWVNPTPKNAEKVFAALGEFGAPLKINNISVADFATPGTVYQVGVPPKRIDILTRIAGLEFADAWPSREKVSIDDISFEIPSAKDLIKNKQATGRVKDKIDLHRLKLGVKNRADKNKK